MGLYQTEEIDVAKENSHQTQETAHRVGENLCQLSIQNLQGTKKFQPQRINTPMKKWAHELNREFSKEEV
jgi:hypothetical protein